ncbi:MAG: hypothetical protein IJ511_09060 [Bacteroides sp.]|nr:hypothetical protein [Bacteroides sp.]
MKLRYLSGTLLLAIGMFVSSCEDDTEDYTIRTGEIVSEITTGAADATAVSAQIQGTVKDLTLVSSSSYEVGVIYSTNENPTASGTKKVGSVDENGNVTVTLTGLTTGVTYYYATYVTLQKKVNYFGEVKSFVATQVKVTTADAADVTATKAKFEATITGTDGVETATGVKVSLTEAEVKEGNEYALGLVESLLPGTTYYYVAYAKVGESYIYGETKSFTTASQVMEYIDLGLSVLWAKCNIGAEAEQESGATFAYGDDVVSRLSIDVDTPMSSQMPTEAHFAELVANTTQEWTTVEGVEGMRFTANNGNSIFMPATNGQGLYWSATSNSTNAAYGSTLNFASTNAKVGTSTIESTLAVRSVRPYAVLNPNMDNLVWGDLEGNGRLRIEIYNMYGATANAPAVDPSTIKFNKNMVVSFTLGGVTDNLKEGAAGSYVAGLEYADADWEPSYWSGLSMGQYEANVTGDGTYTVWMETTALTEGAAVFCVDIANLMADIVDPLLVTVTVDAIKLDADVEQATNADAIQFQNKDGNGTDGRIEIYNEYGNGGAVAPQFYNDKLRFNGLMLVDFTISGIDGNLIDGAAASYKTELSFAEADWDTQYWGGAGYGDTTVTGDGTYQVYAYLNGNCEGAVVWTIELYGLWKDLVDTSKVNVTINKVVTPGKY